MTLLGNCLTSKWLNYSIAIYIRNFHTVKVDHPPYLKCPKLREKHLSRKMNTLGQSYR